ncbi:MAG: hydrogenase maturation nickel metallochaperone HypA [Candidatus Krumholzibacteria bacterium]|nr:hydrogenase maturation nickel metallochaperone HypA [Candidatus Krumholzibacteria bacterium]
MHEMSIAQNIVEIVEDALRDEVDPDVERVVVKIGRLVAVVPDSLDFCFTAITQGTPLANSQLVIEEIPFQVRCKGCDKTSQVESFVFRCPECGNVKLETITGHELFVSHIEVH